MPQSETDQYKNQPAKGQPITILNPNQAEPVRPVTDDQVSDLASDFLGFNGIVLDRLPDIREVRDNTLVIVEKQGYKFLFMAINGAWVKIKSLQPTWDDLRFPANAGKIPASGAPTWTAWLTEFQLLGFSVNEYIFFSAQMPHGWIAGTDIHPHLHLVIPTAGAGAGAENMQWELDYTWANINAPFPASTTLTGETVDLQDTSADQHFIYQLPVINGSGKTLSSMLHFRLTRKNIIGGYSSDVLLQEFDIHYQREEDASEEEYEQIIITE